MVCAAGLAPSLVWLVFAGGGRDAGALAAAQAVAFAAVAVLALRGGLRWPGGPARWTLGAVAGACAAAAVATVFSSSVSTSVPVLVGWLWLVAVAGLVVAALDGPTDARAVVVAVLAAVVVLEIAWAFATWFARGDAGVWQLGTFYFPNAYAAYVLLLGAPVVAVVLASRSWWTAAAAGIVAVFVLLAVVFSASRTAVAIEAAALVLTAGLVGRAPVLRLLALVAATAAAGFVLTSPLVFPRGHHGIASSLNSKANTEGTSAAARHDTWLGAIGQAKDHPAVGTGPGTFGDVLFRDQPVSDWWSRYAHNQYLEALSDGGILLGSAFAAIPVTAVVAGWRRARRAPTGMHVGLVVGTAATALHFGNDIDWSFPAIPAAFVTFAVVTAGAGLDRGRDLGLGMRAAAGLLAVTGLAVLAGGSASRHLREDPASTVAAARHRGALAAALAPWSAAPLQWEAAELHRLGGPSDKRLAVSLLARAHRRDPLDLRLLWDRGRMEAELGDRDAARRTFAAAIALGRRAPLGYVLAAENEVADGHAERAAALLRDGMAIAVRQPDEGIRVSLVDSFRSAQARLLGATARPPLPCAEACAGEAGP